MARDPGPLSPECGPVYHALRSPSRGQGRARAHAGLGTLGPPRLPGRSRLCHRARAAGSGEGPSRWPSRESGPGRLWLLGSPRLPHSHPRKASTAPTADRRAVGLASGGRGATACPSKSGTSGLASGSSTRECAGSGVRLTRAKRWLRGTVWMKSDVLSWSGADAGRPAATGSASTPISADPHGLTRLFVPATVPFEVFISLTCLQKVNYCLSWVMIVYFKILAFPFGRVCLSRWP